MEKIKSKINKLLRLSLSSNPNEAKLAAQKAIELMEKYSLSRGDLTDVPIIIKEFEIEYARVPGWIRMLYVNISFINGCYMAWRNGYKICNSLDKGRKAKIILVGLESDLENIEYYVSVIKDEIISKSEIFKKTVSSKREALKSYRMGLVNGIYNLLYNASKTFNKNLSDNTLIPIDKRRENAENFYLKTNKVNIVETKFENNTFYHQGLSDAKNISAKRPVKKDIDKLLLLENNTGF